MKVQFCGAAKTVTGSCFFLETGKYKVLVDCGMFQGDPELEKLNKEPFPFDPSTIDYVFLTHAHYDHCGRLPLLVKQGFKGEIISTQPTRDLTQLVLLDSAKVQEEDYRRSVGREGFEAYLHKKDSENVKVYNGQIKDSLYGDATSSDDNAEYPLFNEGDVYETMKYFRIYEYGDSVVLRDGLEFRMRDAGHILGSVTFELWIQNGDGKQRKLVFSGDLGQPGQRIIRDPDMIRDADFVFVESTYGDRIHKSKDETVLEFLTILKEAEKINGNVLIPIFAIERTQEIIYELNLFYESKLISDIPVYLDSPMASDATEIFKRYPAFYDEDAKRLLEKGDDPFNFKGLKFVKSVDESNRISNQKKSIIMAGSGMCTGGRILNHLINNLAKQSTSIIFVGYQVRGTLGRRILDGQKSVRIRGREVESNAQLHTLGGFSAHADERDLMYWLRGFGHTPRMIFICHGDEDIATSFSDKVKTDLMIDTHVPSMFETVDLEKY